MVGPTGVAISGNGELGAKPTGACVTGPAVAGEGETTGFVVDG